MVWYHYILATLFAFLAIVLMAVILLQRGRGVGLSGAFGGAGGHTAFGAKTGDVLTWATVAGAVLLLTFAVILNYIFRPPTPLGAAPLSPPIPATPTGTTGTPAQAPPSTEGVPPTTPAETTPGATEEAAPTEAAPADETPGEQDPAQGTPAGGGETPDAAWPELARPDIFGADLG